MSLAQASPVPGSIRFALSHNGDWTKDLGYGLLERSCPISWLWLQRMDIIGVILILGRQFRQGYKYSFTFSIHRSISIFLPLPYEIFLLDAISAAFHSKVDTSSRLSTSLGHVRKESRWHVSCPGPYSLLSGSGFLLRSSPILGLGFFLPWLEPLQLLHCTLGIVLELGDQLLTRNP